jgi:hypothetical protein
MGLFRETLEEARCHAITGDIEKARKIIANHWAKHSTPLCSGILIRMQTNIKEYREALNNAHVSNEKAVIVENIDICLEKLKFIKCDIQKLIDQERIKLE